MAKDVIGYKVVRESGCNGAVRLLSAAVFDPPWVVAYVPGITTYPRPGSALFAFDSLPHAQRFVRYRSGHSYQVWEARLGRPRLRRRLCRWAHRYLQFWSGRRNNTFEAPIGTLACESVALLKKVE